ncbi:hypothetical protein D3C83_72880 [compost metagenome]
MPHQGPRDLFRGRADIDEERTLVGHQGGRRLADGALLLRGDETPRLIGQILDVGGDDGAAMHAIEQPLVAQLVQVLADGLRRHAEARRQRVDVEPPGVPGERQNVRLSG